MALIVISLLLILAIAALVALFVAYPHQGKDIPRADWLTDAMNTASARVHEYVEGRRATSRK
ncbi:MAG TPA: hypothetical protein VFJ14_06620 [Nocardioidaceae bacterium]|nr:hypothetical protein [Nocardioidaceae bacterium]